MAFYALHRCLAFLIYFFYILGSDAQDDEHVKNFNDIPLMYAGGSFNISWTGTENEALGTNTLFLMKSCAPNALHGVQIESYAPSHKDWTMINVDPEIDVQDTYCFVLEGDGMKYSSSFQILAKASAPSPPPVAIILPSERATANSSMVASQGASAPSTATATASLTLFPSPSSQAAQPESKHEFPMRAIVGIAVGIGMVLLLLTLLFYTRCRRWIRARRGPLRPYTTPIGPPSMMTGPSELEQQNEINKQPQIAELPSPVPAQEPPRYSHQEKAELP